MKCRQLAALAVALVLAGCTGSATTAPPSTLTTANSTRPPVIPVTAPPGRPTTLSPKAAIEAELRAIFTESQGINDACLGNPPHCNRAGLVRHLPMVDGARVLVRIDEWVAKRIFGRPQHRPQPRLLRHREGHSLTRNGRGRSCCLLCRWARPMHDGKPSRADRSNSQRRSARVTTDIYVRQNVGYLDQREDCRDRELRSADR